MEPNGDLSLELAKLVPSNNLVYIDPFLQNGYIPTINIFDLNEPTAENISIYTGIIVEVFAEVIGNAFTPASQSILTPIIAVILQLPNSSFWDVLKFLDDTNNQELLKFAQNEAINPAHREYFKTGFMEKRTSISKYSIYTKLQILLQDTIFSNLLTGKSTMDLENLMNTNGKVIIFRLNGIKMSSTIDACGKFITGLLASYAFKREYIAPENRQMTHFFIDEAGMFITERSTSRILEQARKYKFSMHLSVQNNKQLGDTLNASILSNTNVKFITANSNKNHRIMSPEINISVEELDVISKPGEFFVKVGSKKAFKLQISQRLLEKNLFLTNSQFYTVTQEQIKKYYRKIDTMATEYASIPTCKATQNYSLEAQHALQEKIIPTDDLISF